MHLREEESPAGAAGGACTRGRLQWGCPNPPCPRAAGVPRDGEGLNPITAAAGQANTAQIQPYPGAGASASAVIASLCRA